MNTRTPPNILLIHTDQHRADCLGVAGNRDVRTPHIDGLAADGVHFANCFCPYPVCTPSRYSLLTGLYVHQHLGWTNHSTLPPGVATFPALLRAAGYRTAAVGKMHLTPTYADVGFDRMFLAEQHGPGRWDDDYHRYLCDRGLADRVDMIDQVDEFRVESSPEYMRSCGTARSDLPEEHHSTTWIGERALDELRGWTTGGNLLMVGFVKPHHPFDPPAPWSELYDPESITLLPGWTARRSAVDRRQHAFFPDADLCPARLRRIMAMYYATISQVDFQVGRLLGLLRRKGLYDDTLVVFTSDHGEYLGYHHLLLKANHLYEPLAKVPLIVKFPGAARAGTRAATLASGIDLAPTLLRQAGLAVPADMGGLDLADPAAGRAHAFAEWLCEDGPVYMVRCATRKLMLGRDDRHALYFNLETDPHEFDNRFHDPTCRAEIDAQRAALAQWLMFDSVTPTCLDEDAPLCAAPNARAARHGHRDGMLACFRERMRAAAAHDPFAGAP